MSGSNWIFAITIGLTLLCQPTLLLGQEKPSAPLKGDPIIKPGQEKAAATGKTSTTKRVESPPDPSPALEGIESAIRDLIPKVDKTEREWEKQQNIADLQAQKDMAFWAKLMVWATVCTGGITFIGIVLIWRTLHHSRRAADAAKEMVTEARATTKAAQDTVVEGRKATAAANRSADIQEKAFRRLERPYLFIRFIPTGGLRRANKHAKPSIRYTLVNYGKTPAVFKAITISLQHNPEFPLRTPMAIEEQLYDIIQPGGELAMERELEVLDSSKGQSFSGANAALLILHGCFTYEGPTGALHIDCICMRGNPGGNSFTIQGGSEYNYRKTIYPEEKDEPDHG